MPFDIDERKVTSESEEETEQRVNRKTAQVNYFITVLREDFYVRFISFVPFHSKYIYGHTARFYVLYAVGCFDMLYTRSVRPARISEIIHATFAAHEKVL